MVNERAMRVIAHTARMQLAIADKPHRDNRSEHEATIAAYRAEWSRFSEADRSESAAAVAATIPDMNPELVAAAVAALEE